MLIFDGDYIGVQKFDVVIQYSGARAANSVDFVPAFLKCFNPKKYYYIKLKISQLLIRNNNVVKINQTKELSN